MGIFEKLKNALFEEEYVEVVEKPKTQKVSKKKTTPKEKIKEKYSSKNEDFDEEEKPIAKKVVLPEKRDNHVSDDDEDDKVIDDEIESIEVDEPLEKHSTFKMIDDDDFRVDDDIPPAISEPKIVKVIEKDDTIPPYSMKRDRDEKLYPSKAPKNIGPQPYGIEETPQSTVQEYNIYEKKEEKSYFKPSPIISPIYGILDKNYSKDDIVPKREVRLTSSLAREKVSVDDVREKAFGRNEEVVSHRSRVEDNDPTFELEKDDTNLLVDLSSEDDKPSVKDVTMGDAVEYFQDLGLEYNVDYVDAGKKTSGRREKKVYDDDITIDNFESTEKKTEVVQKKNDDNDTDDNLFDLIDSMYQDQD